MSSIELACIHCERCYSVADAKRRLNVKSIEGTVDFLEGTEVGDRVYTARVRAMEALNALRNDPETNEEIRQDAKKALAACHSHCGYTKQIIVGIMEKYIRKGSIEEKTEFEAKPESNQTIFKPLLIYSPHVRLPI